MRKYVVEGRSAEFFPGAVLMLSEEQHKARVHALKPLKKKSLYEVTAPVQFKRGEEIGFDGEVNKALLEEIVPLSAEKKKPEEDGNAATLGKEPNFNAPPGGNETEKPGMLSRAAAAVGSLFQGAGGKGNDE